MSDLIEGLKSPVPSYLFLIVILVFGWIFEKAIEDLKERIHQKLDDPSKMPKPPYWKEILKVRRAERNKPH